MDMDIKLNGVICPFCADIIVTEIAKLQEVVKAQIDVDKRLLHVEATTDDWEALQAQIADKVRQQVPDAEVQAAVPCEGRHRQGAERVYDAYGEAVVPRPDHAPHTAESVTQQVFELPNLDCAHCAAKIEGAVQELDEVVSAHMDFVQKRMDVMSIGDAVALEGTIAALADRIEPGVIVRLQQPTQTFTIEGLHCAHCAGKIEDALNDASFIQSAELDFVNKRLMVKSGTAPESLLAFIQSTADRIEDGVTFHPAKREAKAALSAARLRDGLAARKDELFVLIAAALLFVAGFLVGDGEWLSMLIFLAAYIVVGGKIVIQAVRGVVNRQFFNEQVLMVVASIGAFGIGAWEEAVAVMLFYRTGELAQDLAVDRSRQSISSLMDIRPEFATLQVGDEWHEVAPEDVGIDDIILVRPGEKIPLDGIVIDGESQLDTAALTGESVPRIVHSGEEALSGSINLTGVLTMRVVSRYADSTVAKILELVEHASARKAKMERFVTRFARVYTPAVVAAAVALATLPTLLIPGAEFQTWLYRALLFLVCSCPCALVISIPLSFFGGIGGASKAAILIKGANYLEALAEVKTVVFDKTGTLTHGTFRVVKVAPANGVARDELLACAAALETHSTHPIARSVCEAYHEPLAEVSDVTEVAGRGLRGTLDGQELLVGNARLLTEAGVAMVPAEDVGSVVYVARNGDYIGYLLVADEVKEDSFVAVRALKELGITRTILLSGDRKSTAEAIGEKLGLDEVQSELLPGDKVSALEAIQEETEKGRVAYVGDGLNDAPVLARADVGIAMGGVGSDAAIEAADVVLMTDEPSKTAQAIRIARRTRVIVWENVIFALGVKAVVLFLGAIGIATMWAAVFADVGVAFLAILNAMRAMNVKKA